jgi:hypothetical protein
VAGKRRASRLSGRGEGGLARLLSGGGLRDDPGATAAGAQTERRGEAGPGNSHRTPRWLPSGDCLLLVRCGFRLGLGKRRRHVCSRFPPPCSFGLGQLAWTGLGVPFCCESGCENRPSGGASALYTRKREHRPRQDTDRRFFPCPPKAGDVAGWTAEARQGSIEALNGLWTPADPPSCGRPTRISTPTVACVCSRTRCEGSARSPGGLRTPPTPRLRFMPLRKRRPVGRRNRRHLRDTSLYGPQPKNRPRWRLAGARLAGARHILTTTSPPPASVVSLVVPLSRA